MFRNSEQRKFDYDTEEVLTGTPEKKVEKKGDAIEVTVTFKKTFSIEDYQKRIEASAERIRQLQFRIAEEQAKKQKLEETIA
jgi:hypothetical protein